MSPLFAPHTLIFTYTQLTQLKAAPRMTTMMIAQQEKQTIPQSPRNNNKNKSGTTNKKNVKRKLETKRNKKTKTRSKLGQGAAKSTHNRLGDALVSDWSRAKLETVVVERQPNMAAVQQPTTKAPSHLSKSEKRFLLFVGGGGARWITLCREASEVEERRKVSER